MSTFYPVGGKDYTLASSISSTATSITLTSFTLPITDQAITMATANSSILYGTLQPGTTNSEFISFTGITQNASGTATLTGVTRGLDREYPYTTDATFKLPHPGQSVFILSDAPQVFNSYPAKANDETITGTWTFPSDSTTPKIGSSYVAPTTSTQIASKGYVDSVAIAGAPDATNSVKGITTLSVAAVSPTSPIAVGDNDGRVPTQGENNALVGNNTDVAVGSGNTFVTQTGLQHNAEKYAADTSGSSTAYVVTLSPAPTSYTNGMVVYAKIVTSNTTTTPTINVNSLGAKTIVKGASTALAVGDILANQFVTLIYDGTNFVLQSPVATNVATNAVFSSGTTTRDAAAASGTQTIAHGLGTTPKYVRITAVSTDLAITTNIAPGFLNATTVYNGTTQTSYSIQRSSSTTAATTTDFRISTSTTGSTSDASVGVVTFDSTNISIAWTKSGSPGTSTFTLLWEAQA